MEQNHLARKSTCPIVKARIAVESSLFAEKAPRALILPKGDHLRCQALQCETVRQIYKGCTGNAWPYPQIRTSSSETRSHFGIIPNFRAGNVAVISSYGHAPPRPVIITGI